MGPQYPNLPRWKAGPLRVGLHVPNPRLQILSPHRSADKTIKVWDLSARTAVSTIQDTGEVWSVSWRPHVSGTNASGAFVTGGEDGHLRWWRAAGTA